MTELGLNDLDLLRCMNCSTIAMSKKSEDPDVRPRTQDRTCPACLTHETLRYLAPEHVTHSELLQINKNSALLNIVLVIYVFRERAS